MAEFAIVAPVFFMMVIGFIEFRPRLMVEQVLINASRVERWSGRTTGATTTSGAVGGAKLYKPASRFPGVYGSRVARGRNRGGRRLNAYRHRGASVPFSTVSWMPAGWFLGGKTLRRASQMRKEGFE